MADWLVFFAVGLVGVLVGALSLRLAWRPRCPVCTMVANMRTLPPPREIDTSRESWSLWPMPITKKDERKP